MNDWNQVYASVPLVRGILLSGGTVEDCVIALASERETLLKRIEELSLIAPKRYQLPDGSVQVWHCPESLIPITCTNDATG